MEIALKFCRCGSKIFKHTFRTSNRCFSSEKVVPLNESTLIGRIVLFMNNEYNKSLGKINDELKYPPKREIINIIDQIKSNEKKNHISELKCEEMEKLLFTLNDENYVSSKYHFKRLMAIIDTECCSRLDSMDACSILRLLNGFTQSVPNRITEYKFYDESLNNLISYVDYLTKEELLQTIFYIGLQKKTKNAQMMLKKCLQKFSNADIKSLTVEELCIICNSTFKTSTKLTNKNLLRKVKQTLNDKLYIIKDIALFITLIKTIRHNKYQDTDLLNTITYTILFNQTYKCYSFPAICHILALYADYHYYDKEILKVLVKIAVQQLKESVVMPHRETYVTNQIRPKDITRFLWVLSTLAYENMEPDVFKNVIISKIMERIEAGVYKHEMDDLVNSILYLWILNYQASNLISYALNDENIQKIREIYPKSGRLNLLLTCIFIENKKLFRELKVKAQKRQNINVESQTMDRPNLVKVLTALHNLSGEINKFEITNEIPHLDICGITGYVKGIHKTVYIEVLDDYVCLKNKRNTPIGLMQLKLRLLSHRDEALITVYGDAVEEMNSSELEEYLKSEMALLC